MESAQNPICTKETVTECSKKKKSDKELICKICGLPFSYNKIEDHRTLKEHQEAINKEQTCTICNGTFKYKEFEDHKATKEHKSALVAKRLCKRREHNLQVASGPASEAEKPKFEKEKYYLRPGIDLPEQVHQYQIVLASFLALRLSLNNEIKNLKISMNNRAWEIFGDIVIEIIEQEDKTEIEAIQCKQIENRKDISLSSFSEETGIFSLKKQCEVLAQLRKRLNYDVTLFKLFTLSRVKLDKPSFTYDDKVFETWKNEDGINAWRDKDVVVSAYKKKNNINTTDEPNNIYIFKILNIDDENIERDLSKFSLLTNQKKYISLKHIMRSMIEDRFGNKTDVVDDLVKYFRECFKQDATFKFKHKFKVTKRDVILKVAELILTPFMLPAGGSIEGKSVKLWEDTLERFDVIVMKNRADTANKIHKTINHILKSKITNLDESMKSMTIKKDFVMDEVMKSEIFDGFFKESRKVSLNYLYTVLWKVELVPLVLVVKNQDDLSIIIKVINFLKCENFNLKFILLTDGKVHPSFFPEQLLTFTNMEDLRNVDEAYLEKMLDEIKIPLLDISITLRDMTKFNKDFLAKLTPDHFLNLSFNEYLFKNVLLPINEDIIDNTFVFDDDIIDKVRKFFKKNNDYPPNKTLSYVVNMKGCPTKIEISPDI